MRRAYCIDPPVKVVGVTLERVCRPGPRHRMQAIFRHGSAWCVPYGFRSSAINTKYERNHGHLSYGHRMRRYDNTNMPFRLTRHSRREAHELLPCTQRTVVRRCWFIRGLRPFPIFLHTDKGATAENGAKTTYGALRSIALLRLRLRVTKSELFVECGAPWSDVRRLWSGACRGQNGQRH